MAWDCFIGFTWECLPHDKLLVVVNFAPHQSQCYLRLPFPDLSSRSVLIDDLMSHEAFERDGTELLVQGLYLDLKSWGYHVFRVILSDQGESMLKVDRDQ